MLYTVINMQRTLSLWPVRLPSSDGRINGWHRSAMAAATHAMSHWIRVVPNMSLRAYEVVEARQPDPEWPTEHTFQNLLRIAFRDRIIANFDHPVLKQLRGE